MPVSFAVSKADATTIRKIVHRALELGVANDPLAVSMDVTAVHANGCALRLRDLLAADDFNFAHDVCGIYRHLDRDTGRLTNCFLPRFTA